MLPRATAARAGFWEGTLVGEHALFPRGDVEQACGRPAARNTKLMLAPPRVPGRAPRGGGAQRQEEDRSCAGLSRRDRRRCHGFDLSGEKRPPLAPLRQEEPVWRHLMGSPFYQPPGRVSVKQFLEPPLMLPVRHLCAGAPSDALLVFSRPGHVRIPRSAAAARRSCRCLLTSRAACGLCWWGS